MAAFNRLPSVASVGASDKVALFSQSLGADAVATLMTLLAWLQDQLTSSGDFISQYSSPSSAGFSIAVSPAVVGGNVFLLVTPTGSLATGTIVLPDEETRVHGQEVKVVVTAVVSTLTVTSENATVVGTPLLSGVPFFTFRYDAVTTTWYRVA